MNKTRLAMAPTAAFAAAMQFSSAETKTLDDFPATFGPAFRKGTTL